MGRRLMVRIVSVLATAALLLGAGCRCSRTPPPTSAPSPAPSVRLYLLSTGAGALEPCGCVKDMLGGVDHFAALVANESASSPRRLVLGAGPMLFSDPVVDAKRKAQDAWKAQAFYDVLHGTGLAAWTPGANDFALGKDFIEKLPGSADVLVAANLEGVGVKPARVIELGGERVGVAGVTVPRFPAPDASGVAVGDAAAGLERAGKWLGEQGARIRVALVAMPRGDALRLAENVKGFHLVLVGKPAEQGETNDPPTPPVLVGETLVVEAPNHLQAVAAVDFFVKDGRYSFADGSGIADEERRQSLRLRIDDLKARLDKARGASSDLAARRRDLERAKSELAELSKPRPSPAGSFFRYRYVEIREQLGSEPRAAARLAEYYRQVNEHNREAFKDALPPPVPPGRSGYVGVDACTSCHAEERTFWNGTSHAKAYPTLANQNKQFNLECIGCHVTGYEAPGGSTVAHVDKLENVQCEVCHGPGSRHAEKPEERGLIVVKPEKSLCASQCHHPPHVKPSWSVDDAWPHVIGKGHGG
ncbi:MAG TPA: multiheme c-type cytochrome [Polyangiaceae bacterium]